MGLTGCRPQPLDAVTRNAMLEAVGDDELVTQRKAMRGQFERKIAPDFRVLGEKALRFDAGADGPVFQGVNMSLRDHRDPKICEDARDRLWNGVSRVLAYRINDRCRFAVLVDGPVVPQDHGEPQQLIVLYDVELIGPETRKGR